MAFDWKPAAKQWNCNEDTYNPNVKSLSHEKA